MLAILGGAGATWLSGLEVSRRLVVRTPYGEPSGPLVFGVLGEQPVVFLARHGYGHTIPPHRINYRANIWALAEQGVTGIVALASVGGIKPQLRPGALVLPDQLIDYTWGRQHTFFDGGDQAVTHVDFTEPYDELLCKALLQAAKRGRIALINGGVYACTQGPRLETAAEVRRVQRDGADMVGMTAMPEAALARECGVPYAMLAVVANRAAGLAESVDSVNRVDAAQVLALGMASAEMLLKNM
ncbi:S-methyl-5'-thioinosine phosphorylase [Jeongeupia wiesaeckerbachi]|uniref:S-methyl-5'-thioinosine phosphorylase n=1 Tax=Jeongeupia wiesaeckerbachi TaxID=3051218 RepID=UPI003D800E44